MSNIGGSGYIASHVIDQLLKRGHTVVTTVRSESKANMIREQFRKQAESGQLGFVYVSDFLKDGGMYSMPDVYIWLSRHHWKIVGLLLCFDSGVY